MTNETWENIKLIIQTMKMAHEMKNFNLLSSMNYELFKIIKEVKENEKTNEKK